jgi:WD40 repeat protein
MLQRPASSEDEEPFQNEAPAVANGVRMPASPLFRPANLRCVNTLSGHHSGIRAIAWRSNPQRVYTGSYDNTIKVWHLDCNHCEATLEGHVAWVRSLFCHAHEPLLFSGSDDGEIKIWRTDNNTLFTSIQARAGGVLAITVDYERAWLLAGCYDSSIHVWQLPSCELLHICHGHRSAVKALEIFNGCLLSGSYDRTIKLWDLADECKCVGSLGTRGSVWALTVHEGMVRVPPPPPPPLHRLAHIRHARGAPRCRVRRAAVAPRAARGARSMLTPSAHALAASLRQLLGAVGDSSIKVWRMDTWEQTCTLSGHRGLVLALACYGDRLISGSDDRCIRVWRMGVWECERVLTGHNGGVVGVCIVHGACAPSNRRARRVSCARCAACLIVTHAFVRPRAQATSSPPPMTRSLRCGIVQACSGRSRPSERRWAPPAAA